MYDVYWGDGEQEELHIHIFMEVWVSDIISNLTFPLDKNQFTVLLNVDEFQNS